MKGINRKKIGAGLLASAVGVFAVPAMAEDGISYDYIEAAYIDTEIDDGLDVDGDGVGFAGSAALGDTLFLHAAYGTQEFDAGVDLDQWTVGIGAHTSLTDNLDIVGRVGYVNAELDTAFGDADDDGYLVGLGLRTRLSDLIELEGGVSYVDLDEAGDETSFDVDGRFYLTNNFALGAGVSLGDDITTYRVGVRLEF